MDTRKNKQIDEILNSLNGMSKAPAPDFFYTRLKARMENDLLPGRKTAKKRILQPAFAFAALFIILLVNAVVIIVGNGSKENGAIEPDLQSFASEYRLGDNNPVLYDINQER